MSVPHIGVPMMKAARAVDGIDDPLEACLRPDVPNSLADDAVIGKALAKMRAMARSAA